MRTFQIVSIATLSLLAACGDTVKNYYDLGADGGAEDVVETDAGETGEDDVMVDDPTTDPVTGDAGAPTNDGAVDDPTDPVDPVDPADPVDPVDPTDPDAGADDPTPEPYDFCKDAEDRAPVSVNNGRLYPDLSWIDEENPDYLEVCGNFTGMSWTNCKPLTKDAEGRFYFVPPAADNTRTCIHFNFRVNAAVWSLFGEEHGRCIGLMTPEARSFIWSNNNGSYELAVTPNGLVGCSNL